MSEPLTRRFFATATLALSATLATTGAQAVVAKGPCAMLLASHPDGSIGELFVEWAQAARAGYAEGLVKDDIEFDCMLAANAIRDRIMELPATTLEGFAIKSYLALHHEFGSTFGGDLDIDYTGGVMNNGEPIRAVVADALRVSPLLAAVIGGRA